MADDLLKGLGGIGGGIPYAKAAELALNSQKDQAITALKQKGQAFEVKSPDSPAEVEKAATQFEAMLLQQMFNAMWSTIPKNSLFGGGREEEYYREMFNEALAENVAENQSIGVKEVIARDIKSIAAKRQKS